MHKVVHNINRPATDLVEQFDGIPSAIISDVTSKYEHTMSHEIKPVWSVPSMVGTAVTVKTYPGDNLMIHKAITMTEPGDVLVVDANGYCEAGLVGELLSLSCKTNGLNGIVIDGAVRDVPEIANLKFPVYSCGVSPKGSYKGHPGSINVPISCSNLPVEPGDIIVGDQDGVARIKPENAQNVLADATAKLDAEQELQDQINAGEYLFDIAGHDETYANLDLVEVTENEE